MGNTIQATYVSAWDDSIEIATPARFDRDTGVLDEVQMAVLPDGAVETLEQLTGEYVRYTPEPRGGTPPAWPSNLSCCRHI